MRRYCVYDIELTWDQKLSLWLWDNWLKFLSWFAVLCLIISYLGIRAAYTYYQCELNGPCVVSKVFYSPYRIFYENKNREAKIMTEDEALLSFEDNEIGCGTRFIWQPYFLIWRKAKRI